MSVLQEAGLIKNTVVLIFQHIQCLHVMYSELAWVLVSGNSSSAANNTCSRLPSRLSSSLSSVSYDYA